jgi:sulfofructose kinase
MPTVLLAGSAVVDFVFRVPVLPARAEKYRSEDAAIVGGGCAANAAVAVARLGGRAVLAAPVGDDPVGGMILAGLAAEGVDCGPTRPAPGRISSFSAICIDPAGERQIVNYRDPALFGAAPGLAERLPARFDAALADTRWPAGALAVLAAAKALGVPGVLDAEAPVAPASAALALASHVAFSSQGIRDFTGEADLLEGLARAGADLPGFVAVTDGAAGVWHMAPGGPVHSPAFPVAAVDTLGAGDVWHGAFALALARGESEGRAIRFANAVAAIKVTRPGGRTGTPTAAEVEGFLALRGGAA